MYIFQLVLISFVIFIMTSDSDVQVNINLFRELCHIEGRLESPINLDISTMQTLELDRLHWNNYNTCPKKMKLTNTGCTALVSAKWEEDDERCYISGGPLRENYLFVQMHFHWGSNEMLGSEHYIDGSSLPMELHAVYYNSSYSTWEKAIRKDDGISVTAYLFKLQDSDNPALQTIVSGLPQIQSANTSTRITPAPLANFLRQFQEDYFLYWGSMFTQSRSHNIMWMICREPIGISKEQIAPFRTLTDDRNDPITANYRPLQDRRKRHVFHVNPGGSRYASLLPIPRDEPPRPSVVPLAQPSHG